MATIKKTATTGTGNKKQAAKVNNLLTIPPACLRFLHELKKMDYADLMEIANRTFSYDCCAGVVVSDNECETVAGDKSWTTGDRVRLLLFRDACAATIKLLDAIKIKGDTYTCPADMEHEFCKAWKEFLSHTVNYFEMLAEIFLLSIFYAPISKGRLPVAWQIGKYGWLYCHIEHICADFNRHYNIKKAPLTTSVIAGLLCRQINDE